MNKWEVARVLDEIAQYVELSEANRFKSLAFEKASRAVSALDRDPAELIASGELQKTPGIGKTTASVIEELLRTGKSRYLDELQKQFPAGIFELMRVPRLGLKKVGILYNKLGISNLDELEQACRTGRLKTIKGFGEKTQQKILEGIGYARKRESHFLLPVGLEAGEQIRERLADIDAVETATCGAVDGVPCSASNPGSPLLSIPVIAIGAVVALILAVIALGIAIGRRRRRE